MKKEIRFLLLVIILSLSAMVVFADPPRKTRSERRIERRLLKYPAYQVRDMEARKFERKQLPRPKEWRVWSISLFAFAALIIETKDGFNRKP